LHEGRVVDLAAAAQAQAAAGSEPDALRSLRLLLASGDQGLDEARRALDAAVARGDEAWFRPGDAVRLLAPVTSPRKVFALAGNFAAHVEEGGGAAPPKSQLLPKVFMMPATTLVGPGEPIRLPGEICTTVDYEGELAVVMGRSCRHATPEVALRAVAGYANFNDVSGRALTLPVQRQPDAWWEFFDWLNGKWFDTFGPIGPALVTADEIPNPAALRLQTRVNGDLRQDASTGDMIFGVAETIAWISEFTTLEPGDVVAMGTPAGVGDTLGRYLQPGDVVEVEISGLGVLRNPVVGPDSGA
jgi:2-keto-4-pentenoate hydratase/2-oxohepta-3-ene-1,7-dioic acid hydratase in catechol pathway